MNYWKYFESTVGNRDFVFNDILSYFNGPLNILEIGCARNTDLKARRSDGWSSFHFLRYILANGGMLDIVDIEQKSLDACQTLLESRFDNPRDLVKRVGLFCHNGESFLHATKPFIKYDLVFLDGGDDPEQTRAQFEILKPGQKVLIDDFHAKGKTMKDKHRDYRRYYWPVLPWDVAPEMGAYGFPIDNIKCSNFE